MKPALIAILTVSLLALAAGAAFAEEPAPAEPSEAQNKEQLYIGLCQPEQADKLFSKAEDRADADKYRPDFQAFLADPAPIIAIFEKSALIDKSESAGIAEQFVLAMQFQLTCGFTDLLAADIAERGCINREGKKFSATKAHALCLPLIEKIKAEQENATH